jgi:hypothetical protein
MRLHLIATAALAPVILACGTISTASAAVINFDNLIGGSLSAGQLVTSQYFGSLGVTFSDTFTGGAHAENFLGTLMPGSTSPNVLWTDQGGGSLTGQYLLVQFAAPVTGVSALFGTSLGANITMQAFNGSTLLNSITTVGGTQTGDVLSGLVSLSNAGITSVRLSSLSSSQMSFNFSVDNLTFGQAAAVPEAATWSMLVVGFGVIGGTLRRSRKRLPVVA